MLLNMKTFSDYTDIKPNIAVRVLLQVHGETTYDFTVNGNNLGLEFELPLTSAVNLKLIVQGEAVEIERITVNDYEVMPLYLHKSVPATCWVTDTWELQIDDFYTWYHQTAGYGLLF